MPYTLMKFILWALLLAVIGGIIGWLLRSLTCRVEMARLRTGSGDAQELERMRDRLAELDAVTAERDRLRMEIADVRGSSAGTLGFATSVEGASLVAASTRSDEAGAAETSEPAAEESDVVDGDIDIGTGLTTLVPADSDRGDAGDATGDATDDDSAGDDSADDDSASGDSAGGDSAGDAAVVTPATTAIDLERASSVLGRSIALDDLTVVEGIGPKIAELCAGIGLTTWRSLAEVDVAWLQSMLADAGSRFKMHKPDTWPEQAALLADGRWDDFKALTEQLSGGS